MQNIKERLLNDGFFGKTSAFRLCRKFMPRKRDPSVFTTSISGIPDEAWIVFREEVERYKATVDAHFTMRKALEESILRLNTEYHQYKKDARAFSFHPPVGISSKKTAIQI